MNLNCPWLRKPLPFRKSSGALAVFTLALAGVLATDAGAQSVTIGAGSSWVAGNADHDLDCYEIVNEGHIDLGQGSFFQINHLTNNSTMIGTAATLDVGGDWANQGDFDGGTTTVQFTDDCGNASADILGETTFHTLSIISTSGKQYRFAAGLTQTVTNALILQGLSGQRLVLRSTQPGVQAFINLQPSATQDVAYVDVADHATSPSGQHLGLDAPGSQDSGNNSGWFPRSIPAVPVPTWSTFAAVLLAMLIAVLARRRLQHREYRT